MSSPPTSPTRAVSTGVEQSPPSLAQSASQTQISSGEQPRPVAQSPSDSHVSPPSLPVHVLFTHVSPAWQSIVNEQRSPSGTRPAPGNLMVQTASCEKAMTPSVLGWPPLPVQEPLHCAWLLAHTSMVVSGGAEAEQVPL